MSRLQDHCFRLLCEIDEKCRAHGIRYSLAEHSAWDAVKFGKYHGGMYDTCIMMDEDSLKRFERLVADDENLQRLIVSDGVRSKKAMTRRYIDPSSTLFDILHPRRFDRPCVGVDIRLLSSSGADSFAVVNPKGENLTLPRTLFDDLEECHLEGRAFFLVSDHDGYFKALVGDGWKTKAWPYPIPKEPSQPYNLIYSEDLPYDKYVNRPLVKKNVDVFHMAKRWLYSRWRKKRYDVASKAAADYERYLKVTEDRFICWEHYYPQKDELLSLSSSDQYSSELEEKLGLFFDTIEKHRKKGMGFSFDEDILRIALPFLERDKGEAYVADLLRKIPAAYREESVGQLLARKGVDHPLLRS